MTNSTTTTFEISNRNSGLVLGRYDAETEEQALEAMARDAGYSSYAECCEVTGQDESALDIVEV